MIGAALWLAAGIAGGTAHFALLRWNTALYVAGRGIARPVAIHVLRMATIAAFLAFTATQGAIPLLAAAAGVVVARPIVLRLLAVTP